jgi:putative spermidine/putrescine transport system permease protein
MGRKILLILLILYILVPILMPIIFSFSTFWQDILPVGFTLQWYEGIARKSQNYSALVVSLLIAFQAVLLTAAISIPAAYALNRLKSPLGRSLYSLSTVLPMVFPPVIIGTALAQSFSRPPLALTGTVTMVVIAHTLVGFPFMFRNTLASFATINEKELSEAAASLGANIWQRFLYVIIPSVIPGILTGGMLVFAVSIGEFEVTSMVAGFTSQTLPMRLFQLMRNDMRSAGAMSAILVYVSILACLALIYFGNRVRGVRR